MRKRDDELKIDISDIFGGDVQGPSESVQETAETPNESVAPEQDTQFQEWMNTRDEALQTQSHELERKLHDTISDHFPQASDEQAVNQVAEVPGAHMVVPDAVPDPKISSESPIDFSAPIAPPFMGGPNPSTSDHSADPAADAERIKAAQEANLKKLQSDLEFLMLYDEFRNIILFELKDLVGAKKSLTMLSRTVELAREQYPEIFRNTNWGPDGNLLEDGSVDAQRMIDNKNAMGFPKGEETLDSALSTLLRLRMQAIEKGLGTGLKNKIRARMYQWISEKGKKSSADGKAAKEIQRLSGYITLL